MATVLEAPDSPSAGQSCPRAYLRQVQGTQTPPTSRGGAPEKLGLLLLCHSWRANRGRSEAGQRGRRGCPLEQEAGSQWGSAAGASGHVLQARDAAGVQMPELTGGSWEEGGPSSTSSPAAGKLQFQCKGYVDSSETCSF